MILFRHADPRFPFLWERADQPEARWHRTGEGHPDLLGRVRHFMSGPAH